MMSRKLQARQPSAPSDAIFPAGLHPVLKRVYAARQVQTREDLDTGLSALLTPDKLSGVDVAAALLAEAVKAQKKLLVVGDFDVDGATSSALMVMALRDMGATHIEYLVPNRFAFGYGLTPEIVELAANTRQPDLIITVDNGVSSITGVTKARSMGIDVLVTDHHLPGPELPDACAIVNPNLEGDCFPSKALAGVGVAFYLLLALRSHLDADGWFDDHADIRKPNLANYLDLVALGTVADLVPLDRNNRILVQQGLQRIRAGKCRPGIQALLEIAGRNINRVVAADFGFAVGPRLNAAGRLDDMSLGIECLMSQSLEHARALAGRLDALNLERREIEADMKAEAIETIERLHLDEAGLPTGFCLFDEGWHQGVIGILASRVKEQFHRPVIAFAPAGEGELKGSARSIPGLHIRDTLDSIAARQPELLQKFGGHAMAAGLSLKDENLPAFEKAFLHEIERSLDPDTLTGIIESDGELADEDFSLALSEQLRHAGPWGQGFAEPLFDGRFTVLNVRVVGENHLKLTLRPERSKRSVDAIAFNLAADHSLRSGQSIRVAYRLDTNEYRGMLNLQLIVNYIETG